MNVSYQTIKIRQEGTICTIQIYRPEANNTINDQLVEELSHSLAACESTATVVILEGLPEVFCFGADFKGVQEALLAKKSLSQNPEILYDLWNRLATGPFITIAHVRGKVNAGGVGFVAACDIVLADSKAVFSLSELLFGLLPACVLPFLIRKIGFQKTHYMTLMTKPISVEEALKWGLVDAFEGNSEALLNRHLSRLKRLSKPAILRYKRYSSHLDGIISHAKSEAINVNKEMFADPKNLANIVRYVETGKVPWED